MDKLEQETSVGRQVDEGTALSRFRTQMALDRTMLAWIRTALSMVGFGFGMVAFFRTLREHHAGEATRRLHEVAITFGFILLVLGVVALLLAGVSHWRSCRALQRGEASGTGRWPMSVTLALLLVVLGVMGLLALLSS